mmetsp:Transcript_20576/g.45006  ORF Transcript_20576/g.45006 Transcript_20576/m.45006 type:complete len:612 (-) Transcript_20576:82-1917(-)
MVATDQWGFLRLLHSWVGGGDCLCQVQKQKSSLAGERFLPVAAVRSGGDCGPDAAAWLLNEHGPALYRSRSPETCESVRRTLQQAWRDTLSGDTIGDELQAFVRQRLEQVPEALAEEQLDAQVEAALEAILRGQSGVDLSREGNAIGVAEVRHEAHLPYWFLPSDWARLSEAYQVDFVVHGLPGTEERCCNHCHSAGHIHFGQRAVGTDLSLHVGWRSGGLDEVAQDAMEEDSPGRPRRSPNSTRSWGHWEPLGYGPIVSKQQAAGVPQAPADQPDALGAILDQQLSVTAAGPCGNVLVEEPLQWDMPGLGCTPLAPCACQLVENGKQLGGRGQQPSLLQFVSEVCPPARICPFLAERRISDEVPLFPAAAPAEHDKRDCEEALPTAPSLASVASVPSLPSAGHGARLCVLVDLEGMEDDVVGFREDFIAAVADAAAITPWRVKVLEVGPPVCLSAFPRRCRPEAEDSPDTSTRSTEAPVDTGAGVLAFLYDDLPPAPMAPRQEHQEPLVSPASDVESTRVLAVIREPSAGAPEEPSALRALQLVAEALAQPDSRLQLSLQRWTCGRPARLWGSEARRLRPASGLPRRGFQAHGCAEPHGGNALDAPLSSR